MRAVEMQPAVIQALNVQAQHQQQIAQPQISQEAFAAALERTASLRPEQVQQVEAPPGREGPEMLGDDRGETSRRRSRGERDEDESPGRPAENSAGPAEVRGTRIDLIV